MWPSTRTFCPTTGTARECTASKHNPLLSFHGKGCTNSRSHKPPCIYMVPGWATNANHIARVASTWQLTKLCFRSSSASLSWYRLILKLPCKKSRSSPRIAHPTINKLHVDVLRIVSLLSEYPKCWLAVLIFYPWERKQGGRRNVSQGRLVVILLLFSVDQCFQLTFPKKMLNLLPKSRSVNQQQPAYY